MPPKKRNSGTTQGKEVKPGAESVSPEKKESPELSVKKEAAESVKSCTSWMLSCLFVGLFVCLSSIMLILWPPSCRHRDKDAEFVSLCKSLHVTDLVCDRAWTLWKESVDEVADSQKRLWTACLFVSATDMDVACFTLTQVLKAASLKRITHSCSQHHGPNTNCDRNEAMLKIFFLVYPIYCISHTNSFYFYFGSVKQFLALVRKLDVNLDTISTKVNSALTRLEKKYDVTLALYQRFEKTCKNIFAVVSNENVSFPRERETMRSCWTMFLLAKGSVVSSPQQWCFRCFDDASHVLYCFLLPAGRVLQMEDDLVISFQLLLCTLELCIKRCPPDLLQPLYKSAISKVQSPPTRTSRRNQSKAKSRPPEPEVDLQLLKTLCKENECNAEEVKNVYQTSFSAFLDSLDLSRSPDFPQVNDLNQQYEEHYLKSRGFDGRLFFDGDETVLAPKVEISQLERTPKKNLPDDDAALIPPQTPIRAAMSSIQQLRGDLTSSGDQPSTNLATYFKNCTVDPTQEVLRRLETLVQTFSQKFGQAVGPHCAVLGKQRFTLGVRLYYKVMEAMLKSVLELLNLYFVLYLF
ncbi:hypothetical protein L3Q82_022159 [Scortum barcoo]|uniref:Uncharacterized protein n=1 Tax=Scortum barcoo TaxID=214431 RepID=A0ACB8X0P0_9TELE|nr:hypothetical protein L3Q82_022159 [Scortum barcoo]